MTYSHFSEFTDDIVLIDCDPLLIPGLESILSRVKGACAYRGRSLGLARSQDVVLLSKRYDSPDLRKWLGWLFSVGLGPHPKTGIITIDNTSDPILPIENHLLDNDEKWEDFVTQVKKHTQARFVFSPFTSCRTSITFHKKLEETFGPTTFYAPDHRTFMENYDKVLLRANLERMGVPTIPNTWTGVVNAKGVQITLDQLREGVVFDWDPDLTKRHYIESLHDMLDQEPKLFAQGNIGASGSSSWIVTKDNVEEVAHNMATVGMRAYVIAHFKDIVKAPSILWGMGSHGIRQLGDVSGQLMNGSAHEGNMWPAPLSEADKTAIHDTSLSIIKEIHAKSPDASGPIGFDFAQLKSGEIRVLECNYRFTGASHGAELMNRLGTPYVVSVNVETEMKKCEEVLDALDKHLFDGRSGAIPVNLGTLKWGKFQMVFTGHSAQSVVEQMDFITSTFDWKNGKRFVQSVEKGWSEYPLP